MINVNASNLYLIQIMSQSISKSDSVHFQEVTRLCQPLQKDGTKLSLIASKLFVVLRGTINFEPMDTFW